MEMEIQLNQITALLPAYISLCYVDYREDLSYQIDSLQSCISENNWIKLYEELDDYFSECKQAGIDSYKKELEDDMMRTFQLDKEKAEALVNETYQEDIEEILYQMDGSDALKDLLKNTGKFSLFLDTGLQIDEGSWCWTRGEQTQWLRKIKRKLKIESNTWDDNIRRMLSQASYGGQLVVYFYGSVEELIMDNSQKDWKSVFFTNPVIAIINTGCGSGDDTCLQGHRFAIPFNRNNLFIDLYFKYNYVSSVCGMSQDWCEKSIASFSFNSVKGGKSGQSPLAEEALRDREYSLKYRQGKCTSGDMDITRHRDVYYRNDFPCGNKCPHCGTFWID